MHFDLPLTDTPDFFTDLPEVATAGHFLSGHALVFSSGFEHTGWTAPSMQTQSQEAEPGRGNTDNSIVHERANNLKYMDSSPQFDMSIILF